MPHPLPKRGLHPRNRHQAGYDFQQLTLACPELASFLRVNPYQNVSLDFADPAAVKTLNRALLQHDYGVSGWDLPPGYLCPPIPGRADYLHYLADLLAGCNGGVIPRGASIRGLDIGVGANCVYPLLGQAEYGWRFLGSDIDPTALASAQTTLAANPRFQQAIELRLQPSPPKVLAGLLQEGENFDFSMCNPPFHTSAQAAQDGTRRKWAKLGRSGQGAALNFGGQSLELCCPGGEEAFARRLIRESADLPTRCFWYSTLISKAASLASVQRALKQVAARDPRTIAMAQGQKHSRIVAWTFLNDSQREQWRLERWGEHHTQVL